MSFFKELSAADTTTSTSYLNQIIDIFSEDITTDTCRRKYETFVTGGIGIGVTSSLFQTIYDQDFTLPTANAVFDLTVGINPSSTEFTAGMTTDPVTGKESFPTTTLMMREKRDIYREFAQILLGSNTEIFNTAFVSATDHASNIDIPIFLSFKRLFTRDQIKQKSFVISVNQNAATLGGSVTSNLSIPGTGPILYTDADSTQRRTEIGGQVGVITSANDPTLKCGLIYYDRGVVVLDLKKVLTYTSAEVVTLAGTIDSATQQTGTKSYSGNFKNFLIEASIDNIVDHIASSRFSRASGVPQTSIAFQNITNINSTLFFCRAAPDEFNYSSNPTYVDENNKIIVIEDLQYERSYTFVTSIGLHDAQGRLLAVAKLSRPIEKSSEKDLTFRVRLDF